MGRPPWLILDPDGVLHYCHDKAALDALAKANEMKNFNLYLQVGYEDESGKVTEGNTNAPEHVKGWTGFIRLRWLMHEPSGHIVYVHGPSTSWRATANASSAEWAKDISFGTDFGKFLKGSYKRGLPYKGWSILKAAPTDAEARLRRVMSERHSPPRPSRRPLPYPRHRQPLLPPPPSPSALTSSLRQAAWPW